jgi:RNA polymerase sigma-70 factor (ECF subfamily)
LRRLKRRDVRALEQVIVRYSGYSFAVAQKILGPTGSHEDIEEIVSEVFVTLWQHSERLRPDSNLKAWLAVVSRTRAINRLRLLGRLGELKRLIELEQGTASSGAKPPSEADIDNAALEQALSVLRDEEREIIDSFYLQDKSIRQIAEQTNLSESAVKNRLYRSRSKLRNQLKELNQI